jgi:fructuronate reductase
MLNLNKKGLADREAWNQAGISLPQFNLDEMIQKTAENPTWIHFGAGNIFRGFPAALQQTLLDQNKSTTGIIAAETYDSEIIDRIYKPSDNLSLLVVMNPDGSLSKKVVASISESLVGDPSRTEDWGRLKALFTKPSLQMISMTITEKGYNLRQFSGDYLPEVKQDLTGGPAQPANVMAKIAALAYERYKAGRLPIALVSMDNCAENGKKLHDSVLTIVQIWVENGLVEKEFLEYLNDSGKISFPWTMIDKITPRPSDDVREALEKLGLSGMDAIKTGKNTFIAPFVNAEGPQYLVVEDNFPNGRPPLEASGVIFTDRRTVDRVEKMKVGTCLNPLHTSLAIYGCLLEYKTIAQEMSDSLLRKLVEKVGYDEGLPVVVNPGVIDPKAFIKEVIEVRFPNPYIPDTPQRIATDTSQKIPVRFGQTIRAYIDRPDLNPGNLKYIPLVIAGWLRYLMGVADSGNEMAMSSDPMLDTLKAYLADIKLGDSKPIGDKLNPILSNSQLFSVNLYDAGLGKKVEGYFQEMIAGKGAVRAALQKYLG